MPKSKPEPRCLRVRVIHDSELGANNRAILGTEDLDLADVASFEGGRVPYLKRWVDHLHIWNQYAHGKLVDGDPCAADLFLIDCEFVEDTTAPKLPTELLDARGLLHGLVQVAYLLGKQGAVPFGFEIYSGIRAKMRDKPDAYAVTMFGLLMSMVGLLRKDVPPRLYFSEELANGGQSAKPSEAWASALGMYRARLVELIKQGAVAIDSESLTRCRTAVSRQLGTLAAESLSWTTNKCKDSVLLTSLFADYRDGGKWNADYQARVSATLAMFSRWSNWECRDYWPARRFICEKLKEEGLKEVGARQKKCGGCKVATKQRIWAVAMCMEMGRLLALGNAAAAETVQEHFMDAGKLRYSELDRAIKRRLGTNLPVLDAMRNIALSARWPFDATSLMCVRKYLEDRGHPNQSWPRCVSLLAENT